MYQGQIYHKFPTLNYNNDKSAFKKKKKSVSAEISYSSLFQDILAAILKGEIYLYHSL